VVTKFSDVGAYCTGSLIGRHKMISCISPGKTWEGFAGALVISTACSLGLAARLGDRLAGMTPFHAVVLGVILSVSAVVGDLTESLFLSAPFRNPLKVAGLKSTVLPGSYGRFLPRGAPAFLPSSFFRWRPNAFKAQQT